MPTFPVASYALRDTDTAHPWMVVVDDDNEDDPPEVVVLSNDGEDAFDAEIAWIGNNHLLDNLSVPSSPSLVGDVRSLEHLNRSDPEESLVHRHLIPQERLWRLHTGLSKIEARPERFARPNDHYAENLGIVALSGWDEALRYCLCGIKNSAGRSQPCRLSTLCPPCSYWRRKRSNLAAYLTRFHRTSWFMVTISYKVPLGDGVFDQDIVHTCWRAAAKAILDHQHEGFSRGAMTRLEMHLEQFLPLRYLPHSHSVVDADHIAPRILADRVFAYRHPETGDRITFPVSIAYRALVSEKGFSNALSYVGKALDLATPYSLAWERAKDDQRRLAPSLNQEVDDFLDALPTFTSDMHQVRYGGTLHAGSRNSLRVPRAQRAAQREQVESILADCSLDAWDDAEPVITSVFEPPTI